MSRENPNELELGDFIRSISRKGVGPLMSDFNQKRPPLWPTAHTTLFLCGLEQSRYGWAQLMRFCRLLPPPLKPAPRRFEGDGWIRLDKDSLPLQGTIGNVLRFGAGYE